MASPDSQMLPAGGNVQPQPGPEPEPNGFGTSVFSTLKSMLFRGVMIYFVMQMFRRPQPPANVVTGPDGQVVMHKGGASNLFTSGTLMDLYVYLSEREDRVAFSDSAAHVWTQKQLSYNDFTSGSQQDGVFSFTTSFPTSERVQKNGSLYLHAFIVRHGKSPDPAAGKGLYSEKWTLHKARLLNKYKKKTYKKTSNLLTGETDTSEEDQAKMAVGIREEVISHWHPNITINLVNDFTVWVPGQVPAPIEEFIEFTPSMQNYKPILYLNTYWNLIRDYQPINETVKTLNLTVTFQPVSMFKWQMYSAHEMRNKIYLMSSLVGNTEQEDDDDAIKEALLENNAYLLALTFVVSIVHSIFEFLAFKNDIQFWRNRQSLEGLSVRSVFFNVFQSLLVLLYVMDNETNSIIRIGCFVGLAIEIWKIHKVVDVSVDPERRLFQVLPRIVFKDKGSYTDSGTKVYDNLAFKYLGMLLFPVAAAYSIYSIIYNEHKGWYSFTLSTMYGFLLTFGFIMMTPQLFINYKLKSVAHLPWRMLTYKALNTFIDDIFAFVIKMPTMYRLGCFRDDIVFFIFLYQRYIYRVDHSRVNEFGFSGDMISQTAPANALTDTSSPVAPITSQPDDKTEKAESTEAKSDQEKKQD